MDNVKFTFTVHDITGSFVLREPQEVVVNFEQLHPTHAINSTVGAAGKALEDLLPGLEAGMVAKLAAAAQFKPSPDAAPEE